MIGFMWLNKDHDKRSVHRVVGAASGCSFKVQEGSSSSYQPSASVWAVTVSRRLEVLAVAPGQGGRRKSLQTIWESVPDSPRTRQPAHVIATSGPPGCSLHHKISK